MTQVQFPGESAWDAVINHNSLNIEEEDDFEKYAREVLVSDPKKASIDLLESLFRAMAVEGWSEPMTTREEILEISW